MKRIGLLTMALVLALGSLGVAYAAWTDEITIQGSVNTGNVDLKVIRYSGTWVYKCLDDNSIINIHGWMDEDQPEPVCDEAVLVASAGAAQLVDETQGPIDDAVRIWFDNVFPCQWLMADILLRYDGSIPVKLWAAVTDIVPDEGSDTLVDKLDVMFDAYRVTYDADGNLVFGEQVDLGVQMHKGDMILLAMSIHLPQDNSLMNMGGSFKAEIQAIQWNEFPEGGGFYVHPTG